MASFWELQRAARWRTALYISAFILLSIAVALLIEWISRLLATDGYSRPMPYLAPAFLAITFLVAIGYYVLYCSSGGSYVAESLGGRLATFSNLKEQQLLNIVEEMALASNQPKPAVFIIKAREINAFAAGVQRDNAAIAVTTGALEQLNREELQGVIAHEFGHIANMDMKINMRLAAMIMGFVFVLYLGIRLLEGSLFFGGDRRREGGGGGNNPIAIAALILLVAGAVTWFAGAILRSMVSRQREYLADASAVQFTRTSSGLVGALRKIAQNQEVHDMPRRGMAYSHLYFDNRSFWATLFATHPSLEKRISRLNSN